MDDIIFLNVMKRLTFVQWCGAVWAERLTIIWTSATFCAFYQTGNGALFGISQ
jgi:hypothetical protein